MEEENSSNSSLYFQRYPHLLGVEVGVRVCLHPQPHPIPVQPLLPAGIGRMGDEIRVEARKGVAIK